MAYLYRFFLVFLTMMSLSYFQYVGKAREARERYAQEQEEIKKQADARKVSQYGIDIHNDKRPEIYMVGLQDESTYGDLGSPKISDVYETAYMASGVVGLVGVPVRVSFDEKAQPRITFHYRKDELRGIPERNLIILHEGEDGFYVQVGAEDHDYDSHTISVPRVRPAEDIDPDTFRNGLSDDIFAKIVACIRIAVPYTGMIISSILQSISASMISATSWYF